MNTGALLTKPVPAIVQSYKQEVKADWESVVNQIAALAQQEDSCALSMGDRFALVKDEWGPGMVTQAASEAGISKSVARQRLWVSSKIPKDHWLRKTQLTYGHLRKIAGTTDIDKWGKAAVENGWTINQLIEAIDSEGDKVAQDQGDPCCECSGTLKDMTIVAFTVQGEKRHRCCGVQCAANYFLKRTQVPDGAPVTANQDNEAASETDDFSL
jgi:hypothetical protein